jgi:hypothetical protein
MRGWQVCIITVASLLGIIFEEVWALDDEDRFIDDLCTSPDDIIHVFHLTGGVLDRVLGVWSEVIAYEEEVGIVRAYDGSSDQFLRGIAAEILPENLNPFLKTAKTGFPNFSVSSKTPCCMITTGWPGTHECRHSVISTLAKVQKRAAATWPVKEWRSRLDSLLASPCNQTVQANETDQQVTAHAER